MDSIVYNIKSLILIGILTGGNGIAIPYISDGLLERTLAQSDLKLVEPGLGKCDAPNIA